MLGEKKCLLHDGKNDDHDVKTPGSQVYSPVGGMQHARPLDRTICLWFGIFDSYWAETTFFEVVNCSFW